MPACPQECKQENGLFPQSLKFSDLPCLPRQDHPGSSRTKPSHSASSLLGHSRAQGPAAGRRGASAAWWPVCPLSKPLSQGKLSLAWKGIPAAEPCPGGQQPPGDARLCPCVWLWSQEVAGGEVTPHWPSFHPGHSRQSRGKQNREGLCAGTQPLPQPPQGPAGAGGEMPAPPEGLEAVWALHSSTLLLLLLLLQLEAGHKAFPGTKRQPWF